MKVLTSLLFLCVWCSQAQKKIAKEIILSKEISTVIFDLEHVFSINLKSAKTSAISLKAISEGEYANHFVITENTSSHLLTVEGRIAFTFPNNQDKLSAHKVHAVTIEITVPETLEVTINSDIGNLSAKGAYASLTTNFLSGNCKLSNVSGNVFIQTVNGDINLKASSGHVTFETKTGVVTQEQLHKGSSVFDLRTINGNINIEQSK